MVHSGGGFGAGGGGRWRGLRRRDFSAEMSKRALREREREACLTVLSFGGVESDRTQRPN